MTSPSQVGTLRSLRPGLGVPRVPSGPWHAKHPMRSARRRPRSGGGSPGGSNAQAVAAAHNARAAARILGTGEDACAWDPARIPRAAASAYLVAAASGALTPVTSIALIPLRSETTPVTSTVMDAISLHWL